MVESPVPKTCVAHSTNSSIARVWWTVSTNELRDAEPSEVLKSVGPKTMPEVYV